MFWVMECWLCWRWGTSAFADDAPTAADVQNNLDIVWTAVAAFLVFFMQPGFALVEAGFTLEQRMLVTLL